MNKIRGNKITKPKSKVWNYYNIKKLKGKTVYVCKFCASEYVKNATRMTKHLLKCLKCPSDIKKHFKIGESRNVSIASPMSTADSSLKDQGEVDEASTSTTVSITGSASASSLRRFMDFSNREEQAQLEQLFARAIYASGTPFAISENKHWQLFFQKLRPTFKMPSRHSLSNRLLESEYETIAANIKVKICEANALGLQCDGWSNRRNEAIINFIITTPTPVFFKTFTTDTNRHTAEYMAEKIEEVLIEIGPENFIALVTDNASAMVKARNIIHEKYKHISVYGCVAHTLNLLIGDISKMRTMASIEDDVKAIVKEINNSHLLLATFKKIQTEKKETTVSISLKLPVKTRWGSIIYCLKSLLDTKYALKALAVCETVDNILSKRVRKLILDEDIFWVRVLKLFNLINPIVEYITKLESDKPKLSEVVDCFYTLEKHFESALLSSPLTKQEEKNVQEFLAKRKHTAIHPIHLAANILDPRFNGVHLSNEEQIQGTEFIDYLATSKYPDDSANLMAELAYYRSKEGFFAKPYVLRSVNTLEPEIWWKGTCFGTKLNKLAVQILGMPATSAATERSFSTYGFIHSSKRNRLTAERAGKVTFIAHNLKLLDQGQVSAMSKPSKYKEHEENPSTSHYQSQGGLGETEASEVILDSDASNGSESDSLEDENSDGDVDNFSAASDESDSSEDENSDGDVDNFSDSN